MSRHIIAHTSASAIADPRVIKEADSLTAAGYRVTVLAWDRGGDTPEQLVMPGGWMLERVGRPTSHGAGIRNLDAYRDYWREATRRTVALGADAVHCHNLDTVPIGLAVGCRTGHRVSLVADFHEVYRESRALPQRGAAGVLARTAARLLELLTIRKAALLITAVDSQVDYYRDLGARDVLVIDNAPDAGRYTPVVRDEPEFVVSFIGQKRLLSALENLMFAVQRLPSVRALLVGGGPAQTDVERIAHEMERVEVSGRIEPDAIPELYRRCDAVYACYDADLFHWRTAFPVKVMEAMACALPVVVTEGTYIGDYVEAHGLGFAVDHHDVDAIAAAIAALEGDRAASHAMGRRGREIIERELNWPVMAQRLVSRYDALFERKADGIQYRD